VPLAHRDGAGAGGRAQGPAARAAVARRHAAGGHRERHAGRRAGHGPAGPLPTATNAANGSALPSLVEPALPASWLADLEREARRRLEAGEPEVWDALTRLFEGQLIHTALEITRGRRIEAAQKLGIGRNTITRKIQELGLDD
jgi:two-component system nitrogen regulation response regulator GlnG